MPVHRHDWGQLAYAATGFLTVQAADASWVVPADRAVWIAPGVEHALSMRVRTTLHALYLPPGRPGLGDRTMVVQVTPLVRELISHLAHGGEIAPSDARGRRVIAVLIDQLRGIATAPLELRLPRDATARNAAQLLRADPAIDPDEVARAVGTSRRTLERRFRADTGSALGQWRQRAQALRAMELLAEGMSVTETGAAVGYATTSAFVAAFRRLLGTTPRRFAHSR